LEITFAKNKFRKMKQISKGNNTQRKLGSFDWTVEIANPYKFGGRLNRRRISVFR